MGHTGHACPTMLQLADAFALNPFQSLGSTGPTDPDATMWGFTPPPRPGMQEKNQEEPSSRGLGPTSQEEAALHVFARWEIQSLPAWTPSGTHSRQDWRTRSAPPALT